MPSMPHDAPERLAAAFAAVPDPRRTASVRYPLPALLALAIRAILAGHHSVLAIAEWGARQPADVLMRLGFADGCTPWQSTLQRDVCTLERGHGCQQEVRHLIALTDLAGYSNWPGLAQVFRLERSWQVHSVEQH